MNIRFKSYLLLCVFEIICGQAFKIGKYIILDGLFCFYFMTNIYFESFLKHLINMLSYATMYNEKIVMFLLIQPIKFPKKSYDYIPFLDGNASVLRLLLTS